MQTRILSLSALILSTTSLVAQPPTLTAANSVAAAGTDFPVSSGESFVAPTNSGPSLLFGYWDLLPTGNKIWYYLAPSATPSSALVPTATLLSTDGGSDTLYHGVGATGLELRGERTAISGTAFSYSDPVVELKLPCSFGDTWTDIFAASYTVSGFAVTRSGNIAGGADAWGTLELPAVALDDVLRVRTRKVTDDQSAVINIHRVTNTYYFYNGILAHPLLKLTLDSATIGTGNPTVVRSTEWMFGDGNVGLDEIGFDDVHFTAYPNPADAQVNLSFGSEGRDARSVEVFSTTGQAVLVKSLLNKGSQVLGAFDVSGLAKGVYQVRVNFTDGGQSTQRLVVR